MTFNTFKQIEALEAETDRTSTLPSLLSDVNERLQYPIFIDEHEFLQRLKTRIEETPTEKQQEVWQWLVHVSKVLHTRSAMRHFSSVRDCVDSILDHTYEAFK